MRVDIPGKFFISGEYAALKGGAALCVAVRPHFIFEDSTADLNFHPLSPAGLLKTSPLKARLFDPYGEFQGMGKSTAEFIFQFSTSNKLENPLVVFENYQRVHQFRKTPPSGVDLLTQLMGGYTQTRMAQGQIRTGLWPFENLDWVVFLTGQKVKTHDHLDQIGDLNWSEILELNEKILKSFEEQKPQDFVQGLESWQRFLYENQLEAPTTTEYLQVFHEIPGVLAAKGCGAMGSDAIFILFEKQARSRVLSYLSEYFPPSSSSGSSRWITSQDVTSGTKVQFETSHQRSF